MDKRDIESEDGDATEEANRLINLNKPTTLADREFQIHDEYSQDLFDDTESSVQHSPCINFNTSEIIKFNTPCNANLTTLTQTPRIGIEDSPCQPAIPTIPPSLIPLISTVNESWTSELETPQAKTTAEMYLQTTERSGQSMKSYETMERKARDSMRSNDIIPNVTTPNTCFVTRSENEDISASPILNTMKKRRRPKRRILKSLIDTATSIESSQNIENVCRTSTDDIATKETKNCGSEATLPSNNIDPIDNITFGIDENYSVHNSNIQLIKTEESNAEIELLTEVRSMLDEVLNSTVIANDEEESLMNKRLQSSEDFGEINQNDALNNEEVPRNSEITNKVITDVGDGNFSVKEAHEKSLEELVREIKELEKMEEQVVERKYADIPMDVFTRDAKALENVEMIPIKAPPSSKIKKHWGLISFTQMCSLEQKDCETENIDVQETAKPYCIVENLEVFRDLQEDKLATTRSAAPSSKDDTDIVDILSSFPERDEPALDIDEFSPWFYPSNETKSEFSKYTNTTKNLIKERTMNVQIGAEKKEKMVGKEDDDLIVCSLGSTKNYENITTGEGKMINDAQLCIKESTEDEESIHEITRFQRTSSSNQGDNKENMSTNSVEFYSMMGFFTACGKPITISADKIKQAAKLYDEISLQDRKCHNAVTLHNERKDSRTNNKENDTTIPQNSHCSMGFTTASGKPITINENTMRRAAKLYDEISLQDEKPYHAKTLRGETRDSRKNNEENRASILRNSDCSLDFTTADGKSIRISEDKLEKAAESYNEMVGQDAKHYSTKVSQKILEDHHTNSRDNEAIILQNSYCPVGFSTANGKPIKINEDKLKKAAKSYHEIACQDEKHCHGNISHEATKDSQMSGEENKARIPRNSHSLMGFSTAGGKPIEVNADKLKEAEKLYDETNLLNNLQLPVDLLDTPRSRGIKRRREYEGIDSYQMCATDFFGGFETAGGKPLIISETAMKKAKVIYQSIDITESQFPQSISSTKKTMNSHIMEESRMKNYDNTHRTDIKSTITSGFPTTRATHLEIENFSNIRAKNVLNDEGTSKFKKFSSDACEMTNPISDTREFQQLVLEDVFKVTLLEDSTNEPGHTSNTGDQSSKMLTWQERSSSKRNFSDCIMNTGTSNPTTLVSTGFSSAAGHAIQISNQALSKARNLFNEEQSICKSSAAMCKTGDKNALAGSLIDNGGPIKIPDKVSSNVELLLTREENNYQSNPLNNIVSNKCIAGFSTANGKVIKISANALVKAKNLFATEQENTPPPNSLLKRSSAAIETDDMTSIVSVSDTPAFKSASGNVSSNDTPVGVSIFQTSKRVRFNSDLQARKLFGETGGDTDEEIEYAEKFYRGNEKHSQTPLKNSSNYAQHLLNHGRNKNASFMQDSKAGLYAKSEMFEANDRLMIPKFIAQKSSPLNQEPVTLQFTEKYNSDNMRLAQPQKDRRTSIYSDEITASTKALLDDEENSFDGKSWASAITCSPTLIEDREISVKPISLDVSCNGVQETPTSPIIGSRLRSRKKNKRNKENLLKKDVASLKTLKENSCSKNDFTEQMVNRDSGQSSSIATPTSDCSKDSHRYMSTVVGTALVSKLERLQKTPSSVGSFDNQFENSMGLPPSESDGREAIEYFLENRIAAALEQEKQIRAKKRHKPKPILGRLLLRRSENIQSRISWRQATNGVAPTLRTYIELTSLGIEPDVIEITAATALNYKFKCFDFFRKKEIHSNVHGLEVGDGGQLICDENGYAGVVEVEQAFMASPGVDPALVPERWVKNHYRWIVWKLASMDRIKFRNISLPRMLTPHHIMEQLKYRYDREIDRSQRPALRRIIEKDDPPSRRMVLCVATITKFEDVQTLEKSPKMPPTSHYKVELTDGWYSITATIDSAMAHLIALGKVREGTKLVTCLAELLNCEQGYSPLEIPNEVSLKIHTNSTRRARWDTKLGYCKYASSIPTSLSAILPNGGLIGKLDATIARVYPVQYFERTSSGQSLFRNDKCEDRVAMIYEKERQAQIDRIYAQTRADFEAKNRKHPKTQSSSHCDIIKCSSLEAGSKLSNNEYNGSDPDSYENHSNVFEEAFQTEVESVLQRSLPSPRKVTLVLKVRLIEGDNPAILTIWAPNEDIIDVVKEGNRISISNIRTSGKRSGEFHLTAGRQSSVNLEESNVSSYPRRCLTSIPEVAVAGFNPSFGEFDTVGIVVSLGPAPHGMKNFEVVNLAYPNPDPSDSAYLSVLFWEGIAAYGFSEILSVGATVACTNLQWRRGAPRIIPMAYSTEHSTFTRNPRQTYLRSTFELVKKRITDLMTYVSQCATEIAIEHQKKINIHRSPAVQDIQSKASPSTMPVQDRLTPGASPRTPQDPVNSGAYTPAKYSIQRRLEKLQWYGEPPDLSPVSLNHSSTKVNQKFVPPVRTPEYLKCGVDKKEFNLKK